MIRGARAALNLIAAPADQGLSAVNGERLDLDHGR
jgi:hypothetical protein